MRQKTIWSWQSFFACLFFNGLLGLAIYLPFLQILNLLKQYITPFSASSNKSEPEKEAVRMITTYLNDLLNLGDQYGWVVIGGITIAATIALWLTLMLLGRRRISMAYQEGQKNQEITSPKTPTVTKDKEEPKAETAFHVLRIFQREGRFIDFLKENLSDYDDSQIGAAVRNLQESWKKVFDEHFKVEPVIEENEGSEITIASGFDSEAVKLTGEVLGAPPFKGVVKHRGWKLVKIDLPLMLETGKNKLIIMPAEVEIEGKNRGE